MKPEPVSAGLVPNGLYARIVTSTGERLAERSLTVEFLADECPDCGGFRVAEQDAVLADQWLKTHPDGTVFLHVFDGDSGEPIVSIAVRNDNGMPPGHGVN